MLVSSLGRGEVSSIYVILLDEPVYIMLILECCILLGTKIGPI